MGDDVARPQLSKQPGGDVPQSLGTRALAGIPNSVDDGHMAPALFGFGPGLAMFFVGLCCFWARVTRAW